MTEHQTTLDKAKKSITLKLGIIFILTLSFLIPLSMLKGTIHERSSYKHTAEKSIIQGWAGPQTVLSPILVIPYEEEIEYEHYDAPTGINKKSKRFKQHQRIIIPNTLTTTAGITLQSRYRGIYTIPVYTGDLVFSGRFDALQSILNDLKKQANITLKKPYLSLHITDARGLTEQPSLKWNDQTITANTTPGTKLKNITEGFHIPLDLKSLSDDEFTLNLNLKGINTLRLISAGNYTTTNMSAPWANPNFNGSFLPITRTITDAGFDAQWKTNLLSTNIENKIMACLKENQNQCHALHNTALGVNFYQPVDVYQQNLRSVKYGLLIITLTFGAFFLFEILSQLKIHPIQYIMVGASLTLFYLLLTSLSEHIGFPSAYLIASILNITTLSLYVQTILKNKPHSCLFAGFMALLYGTIYLTLKSQDFALLTGTTLLLTTLLLAMYSTRNINWYNIEKSTKTEKNS